jgi:hypothetical protein
MHDAAWGPGVSRAGTVCRLMTDLEPEGRMARLLVKVRDPLHLAAPLAERRPLILGSYVRVEIEGRDLANVIRLARAELHDGKRVWVMTASKTLEIRDVKTAWSGNNHVYVSEGLQAGELLVTSDLAAPVPGMALRTAGDAVESSPSVAGGPGVGQ